MIVKMTYNVHPFIKYISVNLSPIRKLPESSYYYPPTP